MKSRRLTLLVAVAALGACSSDDNGAASADPTPASQAPSSDPVPSSDSDGDGIGSDSAVIGPLGLEFEVFASAGRVQVRAGDTREIPVTARSVGELGGVWTLSTEDVEREGVGIVTPPPATLDFDTSTEAMFMIAVAAPVDAAVGTVGSLDVLYEPPADSASSRSTASSYVIEVVAADAPIGPIAISDFVGVPAEGSSFDPTVNDVAGDAAIDPSSLRVARAPTSGGMLTVTAPGEFTYIPEGPSGESAEYEICDLNGICVTATLDLWEIT